MATPVSLFFQADILAVSACALFMGGSYFVEELNLNGGVYDTTREKASVTAGNRPATNFPAVPVLAGVAEPTGNCGRGGEARESTEIMCSECPLDNRRTLAAAGTTFPAPKHSDAEHIQRQALGLMLTGATGSPCGDGCGE